MTRADLIESKKLRARLHLLNVRHYADEVAKAHGLLSVEAIEARMIERAATDAFLATIDEALDACRAGEAGP